MKFVEIQLILGRISRFCMIFFKFWEMSVSRQAKCGLLYFIQLRLLNSFSYLYSGSLNVLLADSGKASACTNFGYLNSASFASHLSLEKASRALTTAC